MRYLGWRVLVAFHPVECTFCCIEHKLRRIVTEKALAHVHNGLHRGSGSCLIHYGPELDVNIQLPISSSRHHVPNILFLASNSSCWFEWVALDHVCR